MSEEDGMRGWWSGHKTIDPSELEARFSVEDGLGFLDATGSESISDESLEQLERVRGILNRLPDTEADFVDLYHFRHLRQTDIAAIFNVSQPTVCYRLQRAAARIRFLLSLPELEAGELVEALESFLSDPLDIRIMVLMNETTCQSEVAKQLGVSQGLVRHRFIRSIERMEQTPGMDKYARLFRSISTNLNILREVQRPTWGPKITHALE
jgi:DNA-directed RNA polymerase specialized sigma24 family protein